MSTWTPDDDRSQFFLESDNRKKSRYDRRVAVQILYGLGADKWRIRRFEREAKDDDASGAGVLTPERVSEQLGLPLTFRAFKDWRLAKGDVPLLTITRLMVAPAPGRKAASLWRDLWTETLDRYGSLGPVAVCFPYRSELRTMCLHNYEPVTRYTSTDGAFMLVRRVGDSTEIVQPMKEMLNILKGLLHNHLKPHFNE